MKSPKKNGKQKITVQDTRCLPTFVQKNNKESDERIRLGMDLPNEMNVTQTILEHLLDQVPPMTGPQL